MIQGFAKIGDESKQSFWCQSPPRSVIGLDSCTSAFDRLLVSELELCGDELRFSTCNVEGVASGVLSSFVSSF